MVLNVLWKEYIRPVSVEFAHFRPVRLEALFILNKHERKHPCPLSTSITWNGKSTIVLYHLVKSGNSLLVHVPLTDATHFLWYFWRISILSPLRILTTLSFLPGTLIMLGIVYRPSINKFPVGILDPKVFFEYYKYCYSL